MKDPAFPDWQPEPGGHHRDHERRRGQAQASRRRRARRAHRRVVHAVLDRKYGQGWKR
jgi:hypothetical protein